MINVFGFFKSKTPSKDIAKNRLKLVLVHDRGDFPKEVLSAMKKDLIEVLEKYVEVDKENIEINIINQKDSDSLDATSHIAINTPIKKRR